MRERLLINEFGLTARKYTGKTWCWTTTALLVINDNNYPGSAGREFGVPDNNEFIVIHTAPLLDSEDCRRGRKEARGFDGYEDRRKECEPATN